MAERKETPDILSEILSGPSAPVGDNQVQNTELPAKPAATKKESRPRQPRAKSPQLKSQVWIYQIVSFQNYHGWRPRFINGVEQPDWMDGLLLHEYLEEMSEAGWELVSATSGSTLYGAADHRQLYFKRPSSKG